MYNFVPISCFGKSNNRKRPVIASSADGASHQFESIREAARRMNIPSPNIVKCLKGRLKTAGGYHWQYEKE